MQSIAIASLPLPCPALPSADRHISWKLHDRHKKAEFDCSVDGMVQLFMYVCVRLFNFLQISIYRLDDENNSQDIDKAILTSLLKGMLSLPHPVLQDATNYLIVGVSFEKA